MNIFHLFGRKVSLALIAFNLFVPASVMAEEEPAPVYTLNFTETGLVYDGSEQKPAFTLTDADGEIVPPSAYTFSYTDNKNAGKGVLTITDNDEEDEYPNVSLVETFDIAPKEITISWPDITEFTYNGSEKNVTPTFAGEEEGDEIDATITGDKATDVGSYTAEVTVGNANYKLPSNNTMPWSITSSAISEIAISLTIPAEGYTYDKTAKEPAVKVTAGETTIPASEYTIEYSDNINAGEATVTVTDNEGGNYSFTSDSKTFTIAQKEIVISWPEILEFTYDKTEKSITPSFLNVEADDNLNADITGNKASAVGSYTAVVTINNANYKLPSNYSQEWSINSKTASSTTLVLEIPAEGYTYDKSAKEPQVTVKLDDEVVPSEEYDIIFSNNINAGDNAKVTVMDKEGGNYTIPTATETFSIAPRELTITWSATKDFTYDGTKKSITADISNVASGDNLNEVFENNTGYNVGEYNAVLSIEPQALLDMESLDLSMMNTSNVKNMKEMFSGCKKLKEVKLPKDTSKVEDMSYMFFDCESIESLDLSNMNTSSVIDMNNMFSVAGHNANYSLDLSGWNVTVSC